MEPPVDIMRNRRKWPKIRHGRSKNAVDALDSFTRVLKIDCQKEGTSNGVRRKKFMYLVVQDGGHGDKALV